MPIRHESSVGRASLAGNLTHFRMEVLVGKQEASMKVKTSAWISLIAIVFAIAALGNSIGIFLFLSTWLGSVLFSLALLCMLVAVLSEEIAAIFTRRKNKKDPMAESTQS